MIDTATRRRRQFQRLKPGRRLPRWLRRYARPMPIGWMTDLKRRMGLWNSITIVQSLAKAEGSAVTTLQSSAFGSSPVTGNTIIVMAVVFKSTGATISSVTDTQSNAYTKDKSTGIVQSSLDADIWRSSNITGGATFKITITPSVSSSPTFGAIEVSGLASSPVDQSNSNNGVATTTPTTGSVTTTQAVELLVIVDIAGAHSITFTEPTNFNSQVQESGASFTNMDGATKIDSATETINPQWTTTSATFGAVIVTYKALITVDSFSGWSNPRPLIRVTNFLGDYDVQAAQGVIVKETAQLDKFEGYQEPPPRQVRHLPYHLSDDSSLGGVGVIVLETPQLDKFFGYQEPRPRPPKPIPFQLGDFGYGEGIFVIETPQLDKFWGYQEPSPRALKHVPYQLGDFAATGLGVFIVQTTGLDKWLGSQEPPPRSVRKIPTQLGDSEPQQFQAAIPAVTTIFADRWQPAPNYAPRQLSRLPDTQAMWMTLGVFVTETAQLDKWLGYDEPPPRPLKHIPYQLSADFAATGLGVFVLESVTADRFIGDRKEQPRPLKHIPYQLGDFAATGLGVFVVETTGLDKWLGYQEPRPRALKPIPYQLGDFSWTFAPLFVDYWIGDAKDQPRPLKHIPYQLGDFAFVFTPETILLDKWEGYQEPWTRPVKHIPYQLGHSELVTVAIVLPTALISAVIPTRTNALKRSGESRVYAWDFTAQYEIVAGDSLASVVSITSTPAGLVFSGNQIFGNQIQARVSGGVSGTSYTILCSAQTTQGNVLASTTVLRVQDSDN